MVSTLAVTEIGVSAIPGVVVVFLTQPLQVSVLSVFVILDFETELTIKIFDIKVGKQACTH